MSKIKKTPLMKFINVIKENENHFEDKGFYKFLLDAGISLMQKEKKAIAKAYNCGIADCIENAKNNAECVDGSTYFELHYSNKTKKTPFGKMLMEILSKHPISLDENSEVPADKQVEELILSRLKNVGIEPTSVQVTKL